MNKKDKILLVHTSKIYDVVSNGHFPKLNQSLSILHKLDCNFFTQIDHKL